MSSVGQVRAVVIDHVERRWLVWVVGIAALVVGIMIGYVIPAGSSGLGASSNIGGAGVFEPRQGGR